MAEDPQDGGAPPAKKGGLPKKIFGVPTPVLLAGAATAGAVLLIWLRKRKAAGAGASPTATTSVNSVASAEEAQIQSLESELQQLLSEEGEGGGSAGGGGIAGGSVGGGGGGGVVTTVGAVTTAGTTTTAATTTTAKSSGSGDVAAPAGVSVTPYADYADAAWGPNGTGYKYHYQVLPATGTTPVIDVQNSTANHVRLSPLKASTTYRFRVSSQTPRGLWTAYHTFKTKAK